MFVGRSVSWFVDMAAEVNSPRKAESSIFIKFGLNVQHNVPCQHLTFEKSRSKFKVKIAVLKMLVLRSIVFVGWLVSSFVH